MNAVNIASIGTSGRTTLVHKQDHEGAITIDPMSGQVLTLLADRPEWAEGLTVAQVSNRDMYYSSRLGDQFTLEMKAPETAAYEDFDWLAVRPLPADHDEATAANDDPNYDGFEHYEISADEGFRAALVATILGISEDIADIEKATLEGTAFKAELTEGVDGSITADFTEALLADNFRTQSELEAMHEARIQGFNKAADDDGQEQAQKQANGK